MAKEDASYPSCLKLALVFHTATAILSLETKLHLVSLLLLSATSCDKQTKAPLTLNMKEQEAQLW